MATICFIGRNIYRWRNITTKLCVINQQSLYYHNSTILTKMNQTTTTSQIPKLLSTKTTTKVEDKTKETIESIEVKETNKPTLRERLKQQIQQYGTTVLVFHISISLLSLGGCYLLVSSGLDVKEWVVSLGLVSGETSEKMFATAGTFAVAYAIHKVFAPARIVITLTCVPFIVRYLRKYGYLKEVIKKT